MRALILIAAIFAAAPALARPGIGDAAPALALPALDGGAPVTLAAGEVVIVDFFATWCLPCHEAVAVLDELVRPLGARVRLVIVDEGEDRDTVRRWFAAHPAPPGARVALDPDGAAAARFGQDRLPTTFLIDRRGFVRHINRGFGRGYPARVSGWLAGLLADR